MPAAHHPDFLPLVYSCSGCSSAAQFANDLALRLDREGVAQMSCIAGVGGNVPSLVRRAQEAIASGRPILAIDGCVLACARACLDQRGVRPTEHLQLGQEGVKKQYHTDFDPQQFERLYAQLKARVQVMAVAARPVATATRR
ncbi:putative zinc-binding protein [Azohydromonas lata]|uniref:Zinc-binding protein n=1 Tax=Azohydromonas lata TaxID=45677 RepID=A0ABU5IG50_9BURK|nr:putative zinc-binding protein [Azohydromonas lata]MDZ5457957.1 putative zinc-binding protein [Azohydromonas lata]